MNEFSKRVEEVPDEFTSIDEAAEFWDTHDTTDYLEMFETVTVEAEFKQRHFMVEIDQEVMKLLNKEAKKRDVTVNNLVNELLKEKLIPVT